MPVHVQVDTSLTSYQITDGIRFSITNEAQWILTTCINPHPNRRCYAHLQHWCHDVTLRSHNNNYNTTANGMKILIHVYRSWRWYPTNRHEAVASFAWTCVATGVAPLAGGRSSRRQRVRYRWTCLAQGQHRSARNCRNECRKRLHQYLMQPYFVKVQNKHFESEKSKTNYK